MISEIQKLITDDSIALCKDVEIVMNTKAVEAGSEKKELNEKDEKCSLM